VKLNFLTGAPEASHEKGFESVEYAVHEYTGHFLLIHILVLIWIWEFTVACHQFVISSTVATWYFSRWHFFQFVFFQYIRI